MCTPVMFVTLQLLISQQQRKLTTQKTLETSSNGAVRSPICGSASINKVLSQVMLPS